jgi:hypothetical protein
MAFCNKKKSKPLLLVQRCFSLFFKHFLMTYSMKKSSFIGVVLMLLSVFAFSGGTALADDARRTLLTPDHYGTYNPGGTPNCDEPFDADASNQLVPYSNAEKGIAFDVPYNAKWGSKRFSINPYDEVGNKVLFGQLGVFEGCGWMRGYALEFIPHRSAEEAVKEAAKELTPGAIPPTVVKINGLSVVKYADSGLCWFPVMEVVGKKYNYVFAPLCSSDPEYDFVDLEKIVKSVKLL